MAIDNEWYAHLQQQQRSYEAEGQLRNQSSAQAIASGMLLKDDTENLVVYQLNLNDLLERIGGLLGIIIKLGKNGRIDFSEPEDKEGMTFNTWGTREILKILNMYLNRNTLLSNYDIKTINTKMNNLSYELTDSIYLNYEKMGWTTLQKRKGYPMLIRAIVDAVHSAYLRALGGLERDNIKTARVVTQNQPLMSSPMMNMPQMIKKRSVFRPWTW